MRFAPALLGLFFLVPLAPAAEEECQTAYVEAVSGEVVATPPQGTAASLAGDSLLAPGTRLDTAAGAFADLRLCDGTGLRVGESTRFVFLESDPSAGIWSTAFELAKGSLRALVQTGDGESVKLRVRTPTASLGVRGTEFVAEVDDAGTDLHTLEGEVLLGSAEEWPSLRQLRGAELRARFERVGREQASRIARGSGGRGGRRRSGWRISSAGVEASSRAASSAVTERACASGSASVAAARGAGGEEGLFQRTRPVLQRRVDERGPGRAERRQDRRERRPERGQRKR